MKNLNLKLDEDFEVNLNLEVKTKIVKLDENDQRPHRLADETVANMIKNGIMPEIGETFFIESKEEDQLEFLGVFVTISEGSFGFNHLGIAVSYTGEGIME